MARSWLLRGIVAHGIILALSATGNGQAFELHWDDGALEGTVTGIAGPQQIFLDPVPAP